MTLFNDIMHHFDELVHAYGRNMSILWSPSKIWMPKNFTTANFRHPVSKSWLRHCFQHPLISSPAFLPLYEKECVDCGRGRGRHCSSRLILWAMRQRPLIHSLPSSLLELEANLHIHVFICICGSPSSWQPQVLFVLSSMMLWCVTPKTTNDEWFYLLHVLGHKLLYSRVKRELLFKILYNWYFLQAFNFCYFCAPHDSTKITSFKWISCFVSPLYLCLNVRI